MVCHRRGMGQAPGWWGRAEARAARGGGVNGATPGAAVLFRRDHAFSGIKLTGAGRKDSLKIK